MKRPKQPTFGWQGDRWRPATARLIEKRLRQHREELAECLSIDLSEQEARTFPPTYPTPDHRTEGDRYVAWRQSAAAGAEIVPRIDLAIEEITSALRRCWALNRDVNRAGSYAKVRHTLEALLAEPDSIQDRWPTCDPETRGIIEAFYPGGWLAIGDGAEGELLKDAITSALAELPSAKRGRPKDTPDYASRYLGPALAEIYAAYADDRPKRGNRKIAKFEYGELQTEAYGRYTEFVALVLLTVPERLRRTKDGGLKSADHLVREGIEYLRSARD